MVRKIVKFYLMPHSVHEVTQTIHKLSLMQMRQRGYPISAATIMESFDVQDVERPDGSTEQERFWAEKKRRCIMQLAWPRFSSKKASTIILCRVGHHPPAGMRVVDGQRARSSRHI